MKNEIDYGMEFWAIIAVGMIVLSLIGMAIPATVQTGEHAAVAEPMQEPATPVVTVEWTAPNGVSGIVYLGGEGT